MLLVEEIHAYIFFSLIQRRGILKTRSANSCANSNRSLLPCDSTVINSKSKRACRICQMPEIKPVNLLQQQRYRNDLKIFHLPCVQWLQIRQWMLTGYLWEVQAHLCSFCTLLHLCQTCLLLDLPGATDKTYSICVAHHRLLFTFFIEPFVRLQKR